VSSQLLAFVSQVWVLLLR